MNMNNHDYNIVNENSLPQFTENSPALALSIHSVRNRARAGIYYLSIYLIIYLYLILYLITLIKEHYIYLMVKLEHLYLCLLVQKEQ